MKAERPTEKKSKGEDLATKEDVVDENVEQLKSNGGDPKKQKKSKRLSDEVEAVENSEISDEKPKKKGKKLKTGAEAVDSHENGDEKESQTGKKKVKKTKNGEMNDVEETESGEPDDDGIISQSNDVEMTGEAENKPSKKRKAEDSEKAETKEKKKKKKSKSEIADVETSPPAKKEKKESKKDDEINDLEKDLKEATDPGAFENFRISPVIVDQLKAKGISALFPVQIQSFDVIYDGFDAIVQARTGSGKTLCFALPIIDRLLEKKPSSVKYRAPQVLVMAPTRELAKQVADTFSDIVRDLTVVCVYGGTPVFPQERAIRSGVDIIVGTPGRIQDFINRGTLDLTQLKHVVLDEVDRMLDMGFADSVDEILQQRYVEGDFENNPQTLLFSATLPHWVHQTAQKYLRPERKHIDLVGDDIVKTSKTVQHLAIRCSYFDRASTIGSILQVYSGSQGRAMIFCETKRDVDELAMSKDIKQETHVIHGDIPQDKREMVLKGFRDGRYRCLIATDVAARGLDIPEVDLVVQCSPPKDAESYIHRSGRTGRAGRDGTCVLFYKPNEEYEVYNVERRAGIKFKIIGPPNLSDIISASAEDAAKSLTNISPKTAVQFRSIAEKLMKDGDALQLVSAALAIISGNSELKPRSLLNSREGFTTYFFQTSVVLKMLGYVWRALERCLTHELKEKIVRMRMCADYKGCVFDLPSEHDDELEEQWTDSNCDTLAKAMQLPELSEQYASSSNSQNSNVGGMANQSNGSFRGRNGSSRGSGNNYSRRSGSSYRGSGSYSRGRGSSRGSGGKPQSASG